jgi:hypothetical protein
MDRLQALQNAARNGGFVDVQETEDGTVLWLKKATAEAEDRMCIDSLTNSATVFWATIPWKINSKTFRQSSELEEWLVSRPGCGAPMTNHEALLPLSANKDDRTAMTSLHDNNAKIIHTTLIRYFRTEAVADKTEPMLMQRIADHARLYEDAENAEAWFAKCANTECDRLRNEEIREKADSD